jgi:hypothetical protein
MKPCTVVSILPYELNESKPQLEPGVFIMPPVAKKGDVQVLSIEQAQRPFYVDYERGVVQIPYDPEIVARSVVEDHIRATIHISANCQPGLFYVHGIKDADLVKKENAKELKDAEVAQNAWFKRLVKAGDDVWQRYRRHNTISDQHRMACKELGLKREWAEDMKAENTVECQYCTTLISGRALICPICRLPQEEALKRMPQSVQDALLKAMKVGA